MSKLPRAPLIEVIFELRWTTTQQELQEVQNIHGDLYPLIKKDYPFRETLQSLPMDFMMNLPTHRFRTSENDYPLIQVGPGLLTINTIDLKYFWEDFHQKILDAIQMLQKVYTFKNSSQVRFVLQYIDLINFDFEKEDVIKFLKGKLNVTISQNFYNQKPITKNLILSFGFENDLGILSFSFNRGKNTKNEEGIAIQTNITSKPQNLDLMNLKKWLQEAHDLCSESFKQMTKGELYNNFMKKV